MPIITDIADALVTDLNAETFDQAFDAVRSFKPEYALEDMDELHVTVVPKSRVHELLTRRDLQKDYQFDIAVQVRFAEQTATEIDPYVALVEDVMSFLEGTPRLVSYPSAIWIKSENDPLWIPEHMETFRQFTSVITVTYRLGATR